MRRIAPALLLLGAVACAAAPPTASPSPSAPARRTTTATLHIVEPTAGQQIKGKVTVRVRVDGAPVLDPNDTTATDGGHVHLYIDGALSFMTQELVQRLTLKPGPHSVRAEFVAPDHQPFLDPVVATVVFTVRA